MQTIIQSLPGYRLNTYLLVLNPHEELFNKIMGVKKEFMDTYKVDSLSVGKPHVTLAKFEQLSMKEERLVNRLRTIAMGYHPFKVELKDYGSFPTHSIYINIVSKIAIQGLVKEVREQAQQLMKLNDENKPFFIMEPHMTIARNLKHWQYEKGWLEYSHKHFTGRFIADTMTLLRRPEGETKYQLVQKFQFQNLPVTTRQGELF